jgi:hypothetical protein
MKYSVAAFTKTIVEWSVKAKLHAVGAWRDKYYRMKSLTTRVGFAVKLFATNFTTSFEYTDCRKHIALKLAGRQEQGYHTRSTN